LKAVIYTGNFINHFQINSEHHSSPAKVKINQFLLICLVIVVTVQSVLCIVRAEEIWKIIRYVLDIIGFMGMSASVVCVESRLDAYRQDREAAGWTEEKGYPEGYVHEYDKKQH